MKFAAITHCDQLNGEGNRVVLWVSGCSHNCKNCHNPYTHNPNTGEEFTFEVFEKEIKPDLQSDWCSGITFSGGDPLFETNRETIINLAKHIKENFPIKTIWLYTGYTIDQIKQDKSMNQILNYVDVLCDGVFIENLKSVECKWVGSINQNVIKLT